MQEDKIESVEARTVRLNIPKPLRLGRMTIKHRSYAVCRVRTTDGIEGVSYALSRDLPVAETIRSCLAPCVVGFPADAISAVWRAGFDGVFAGGRVGAAVRALGLIDIALWDVKGKRAGMPVWRLLGGDTPVTECVMVAGYPTGDDAEAVGARVAEYGRAGHRLLKVSRAHDPRDMRTLLATAADALPAGCRVIVDAGWCWHRASDAINEIRQWVDAAQLAWVEDPLPPEDVAGYCRLVDAGVVPIGVGDDLTDTHVATQLAIRAGVDVLRIDAPALGGITPAVRIAHVAGAVGALASFHVYPETHVHLAAAFGPGVLTETFDGRDNPFDPAPSLYQRGPVFGPGTATAPEAPGLGIELDEQLVAAHTVDTP